MEKVVFYVDGFNFYYGLKTTKNLSPQWVDYYWIDFVKLFQQFLSPTQELAKVVYFTATPLNKQKAQRQGALLKANQLINKDSFEIVRGKYFTKYYPCPNCKISVPKPEEKRTDVNISVRMIEDCIKGYGDIAVLVSADSDLVPPIKFIREYFPSKKIRVYFPPSNHCSDLANTMRLNKGKVVFLLNNEVKFRNSIMDDRIEIDGDVVTKPEKWNR